LGGEFASRDGCAVVLTALADPTRRDIFERVARDPQ
jgi:hypothetical protein